MPPRIIIKGTDMNRMTTAEQEYWWRLSRTCEVYEDDVNGELWQVLDCTEDEEENK